NAIPKKCVHPVPRTVKKLIGNYKIQRFMFLFQRANGRDGNNPLHSQHFEAINVCSEVQFGRQNPMSASMPREKSNLSSFERAQYEGVGRRSKRGVQFDLACFGQPRHGIKSAAADNPNFRLWQFPSYVSTRKF